MYNGQVPTEIADRSFSSNPLAVSRELTNTLLNGLARSHPERFDALERAGFKTERYGSIMHHVYERLGGHYLDVGVSAKIAQGLIHVKSGSLPLRYTASGLEFEDGSTLDADVIIFATGFELDLRLVIKRILGDKIAAQLRPFWELDDEGELAGEARAIGRESWSHPPLAAKLMTVGRFRSRDMDAWWDPRHFEVFLEIYRIADQGLDHGHAADNI